MNRNDTELEQVVHSHRRSFRSGCSGCSGGSREGSPLFIRANWRKKIFGDRTSPLPPHLRVRMTDHPPFPYLMDPPLGWSGEFGDRNPSRHS